MYIYVTINEILERLTSELPTFMIQKYMNPAEISTHVYDCMRVIGMIKGNETELIKLRLEDNKAKIPEFVENIIYLSCDDIIMNRVDILDMNKDMYSYTIEDGYIISDKTDKDVYMKISSLPLDENGDPLIINKIYAINAIKAYLKEKLCNKLYWQDLINEHKYERAKQEWLFYSGQARVSSLLPSVEEEYKLSNSMLRVLPKLTRGRMTLNKDDRSIQQVPIQDLNDLVTKQYNT